ncbi:MAG: 1-deoxy-D-xylulose-5-phosphate reductoisomerase, partial [Prevotella sp.]|nr:1-deoxy-D-xylulose-5-phosphate reductoisomerase [Prevotella sp.]
MKKTDITRRQQVCILGSTGSIGTQALDVISRHEDRYEVYCLTANTRVKELAAQARAYRPACVVVADESRYGELKALLGDCKDIKIYAGAAALDQVVEAEPVDMVIAAMVGFAGLSPAVHAIRAGKKICLANKETLVVAGELICDLSVKHHAPILPVDSEHSAIFQSLAGENADEVERI